jgi:hypothetical protein
MLQAYSTPNATKTVDLYAQEITTAPGEPPRPAPSAPKAAMPDASKSAADTVKE